MSHNFAVGDFVRWSGALGKWVEGDVVDLEQVASFPTARIRIAAFGGFAPERTMLGELVDLDTQSMTRIKHRHVKWVP